MNKGLLGFFSIFIALFVGALYYTNIIQSPFIYALNTINIKYHNTTELITKTIDKHFFQAEYISDLEEELQKYENNHLVMQQLASEVNDFFRYQNSKFKSNPKVELVRAISYKEFANHNRVWLEVIDYNSSKVYGLTYKELVAGIVIPENGRAVALLNRDIKSTYAVSIGSSKAHGVAHGNNSDKLIVKYIPAWFTLRVGDEVVTSGLDNIFFKGLKVGVVESITKSQGYQNAIIDPYYKSNDPNYFYMIREVK
ncbi:rod shape-determining protein MreC [Sulfurimonas sp.]|nr:rod shape-determining protein MreC [Sulfurimonas sp.]